MGILEDLNLLLNDLEVVVDAGFKGWDLLGILRQHHFPEISACCVGCDSAVFDGAARIQDLIDQYICIPLGVLQP